MSVCKPVIVTVAVPAPDTTAVPVPVTVSVPVRMPTLSCTLVTSPFGSLTDSPVTASGVSSFTTFGPGTTFTGSLVGTATVTVIVLGTRS